FIERREVTYSYEDGDLYYFMDNETYEQIPVAAADVAGKLQVLQRKRNLQTAVLQGQGFQR
ncbi:translation elongation factor P, partial [human gut metagenome]